MLMCAHPKILANKGLMIMSQSYASTLSNNGIM